MREKLDGASFCCVMFGACFCSIKIVTLFFAFAAGLQAVKHFCLDD